MSWPRSLLYVPGSSEKMISKSFGLSADVVILDLEDAVSRDQKAAARDRVAEIVRGRRASDGKPPLQWVRINAVDDPMNAADVAAMVVARPDAVVLPKADAASVAALEALLNELEAESVEKLPVVGLIETCRGLLDLERICESSERLIGLQLGAEDLTKELGVPRTVEGEEIRYARSLLVIVGRAYGIQTLDTPNTAIGNPAELSADTGRARALGMTGKTCIHPSQIDIINRAFSPSAEAIAQARRIVSAFEQAQQDGLGAIALDGLMIDAPVAERARDLLRRSDVPMATEAVRQDNERNQ